MDSLALTPDDADARGTPARCAETAGDVAEYTGGVFDNNGAYLAAVKRCQHVYRAALDWVGIERAGGIDYYIEQVGRDLDSGEFFLTRVGRIAQTDPALVIALLVIRMRWIEEYQIAGSMEKFLIDQTLIAFYHQLRLHELIGNVEARAEHEFFGEKPLKYDEFDRRGHHQYKVDDYLQRINERLLPAIERCQRMLIRSLREMRLARITRLTIQHVDQVNLAQQQLIAAMPAPVKVLEAPTAEPGECVEL